MALKWYTVVIDCQDHHAQAVSTHWPWLVVLVFSSLPSEEREKTRAAIILIVC
jgi:hypothetical protein